MQRAASTRRASPRPTSRSPACSSCCGRRCAASDQIPGPQAAALEGALALRPAPAQDRFAVGAATLSLLAGYADDGAARGARRRRPLARRVQRGRAAVRVPTPRRRSDRRRARRARGRVVAARRRRPGRRCGSRVSTAPRQPSCCVAHGGRAVQPGRSPIACTVRPGESRSRSSSLAQDGSRLADLPCDAPLPVVTSVARVYLRALPVSSAAHPRRARPGRRQRQRRAAGAGPRRGDARARRRRPDSRRGRGPDHACTIPASSSGTRSCARPSTATRRRTGGVPCTVPWPAAFPDADADRRAWHLALASFGPDDAASSALEQAGQRARQRSAYDVASRAFERAALLAPDEAGGHGCCTPRPMPPGSAGSASGPPRCSTRRASTRPTPELAIAIEHLRGYIATRLGPHRRRAARSSSTPPSVAAHDRPRTAVVMLAEAVQRVPSTPATPPTMRLAAERAASLAPAGADRPYARSSP